MRLWLCSANQPLPSRALSKCLSLRVAFVQRIPRLHVDAQEMTEKQYSLSVGPAPRDCASAIVDVGLFFFNVSQERASRTWLSRVDSSCQLTLRVNPIPWHRALCSPRRLHAASSADGHQEPFLVLTFIVIALEQKLTAPGPKTRRMSCILRLVSSHLFLLASSQAVSLFVHHHLPLPTQHHFDSGSFHSHPTMLP